MARKTKILPPTNAEDLIINRGIALDPDNPEWSNREFARAKPAKDVLPQAVYEAAMKRRRGQRGPQKTPTKKALTLRLDPDIIEAYRAGGRGWQARMNDVLRRGIKSR